MAFDKTVCPITRSEFKGHAKPITVTIDGKDYEAEVKEFSTGSFGFYLNGKVPVTVNGTRLQCQVGMNLTVVGSKETPKVEDEAKKVA